MEDFLIFVNGELYTGSIEYVKENEHSTALWLDAALVSCDQDVFLVDINGNKLMRCEYMRLCNVENPNDIYFHVYDDWKRIG